ncbi:MAG: hypothetical protein WBQ20_15830, partial [Methyloceanibacter sp.]
CKIAPGLCLLSSKKPDPPSCWASRRVERHGDGVDHFLDLLIGDMQTKAQATRYVVHLYLRRLRYNRDAEAAVTASSGSNSRGDFGCQNLHGN